ncbi:MAG: hypothetical protein QG650_818 [Patescibacteria group bacterium]|nr:hypothetical protein [Patescibacteria group bacterium]
MQIEARFGFHSIPVNEKKTVRPPDSGDDVGSLGTLENPVGGKPVSEGVLEGSRFMKSPVRKNFEPIDGGRSKIFDEFLLGIEEIVTGNVASVIFWSKDEMGGIRAGGFV